MDRTRKTSMISFRVENQIKKKLQDIALRKRRALSSVIVGILQNALASPRGNVALGGMAEERRRQPRKQVLLPARWRIKQKEDVLEHDVILRNIGVGGAYTEYISGQGFRLIRDLQDSALELFARIPGAQEPISVECKVSRIHITGDCIGVGLRFLAEVRELLAEPY